MSTRSPAGGRGAQRRRRATTARGAAPLENLSLRDQLHVDRLPWRLLHMGAGLTGFGLSLALLLRSGPGGAPWDVLHAALADRIGASVGALSIAVSFVVLLAFVPLRQQVGIGTIANAIWVGASTGWLLGGPIGVGTAVYALGLGPVIQLALPWVTIPVRTVGGRPVLRPGPSPAAPPRSRTGRWRWRRTR